MAETARKLSERTAHIKSVVSREESRKKLRIVFANLLEPKELLKITAPSAMAKGVGASKFLEHVDDETKFWIKTIALFNSQWNARKVVANLEEATEEIGVRLELLKLTKDECWEIPGFEEFLYGCITRRFVAIKATNILGEESVPILFSPNMILFQHDGSPFMGVYEGCTDFSAIFENLEFR